MLTFSTRAFQCAEFKGDRVLQEDSSVIKNYNYAMNGIDWMDRYIFYYNTALRTKNWQHHDLTSCRLVLSFVLDYERPAQHRHAGHPGGPPLTLLNYVIDLINIWSSICIDTTKWRSRQRLRHKSIEIFTFCDLPYQWILCPRQNGKWWYNCPRPWQNEMCR